MSSIGSLFVISGSNYDNNEDRNLFYDVWNDNGGTLFSFVSNFTVTAN